MARAYSQDLRDRVIDAGTSARAAARRQGQPRHSKLDPHRGYLLGMIEAAPDITMIEMQERLLKEVGVSASVSTIWTFLDRAGLTFKKRPPT